MSSESSHPFLLKQRISLQESASRFGTLATKLSEKIQQFEIWLSDIQGKTEMTIWADDPTVQDHEIGLRFHRVDKRWILSVQSKPKSSTPSGLITAALLSSPLSWTVLRDAPLETKLKAVQLFEKLINAMDLRQRKLVDQLEQAVETIDSLALPAVHQPKEGL